jgi:tripartite-type tricarboxylate transporter receptor subunit TctC
MWKISRGMTLALFAFLALAVVPAHAAWPERPIRMIVPYGPGGTTDNTMRAMHRALEEELGQTIRIENVGGGGGIIGTARALQERADGYTFVIVPTATIANPHMRQVPFDYKRDVQPVARVQMSRAALVARPDFPASNVAELVKYAKERPGQVTFGSAAVGGITHLYGELFAAATGIELTHVPFRGSGEALNAVMGGHVDLMFDSNVLPQIVQGAVRAIAYLNEDRWPAYPDVQTLEEQGVTGASAFGWFGVLTRKGAPKEAVDRMAEALKTVLERDDVLKRLDNLGLRPAYQGPEEFHETILRDTERFRRALLSLGLIKE